jgi:hypothetical protein
LGGKFTGRRKIRHSAGNLAAQAAFVAIVRYVEIPEPRIVSRCRIDPLSFPFLHLAEKYYSFTNNSCSIDPPGAWREVLPPCFPLKPVYIAKDEKQRETRMAKILQDKRTCSSRILLSQVLLKLIRFD